jgi:hypothetical protein
MMVMKTKDNENGLNFKKEYAKLAGIIAMLIDETTTS